MIVKHTPSLNRLQVRKLDARQDGIAGGIKLSCTFVQVKLQFDSCEYSLSNRSYDSKVYARPMTV